MGFSFANSWVLLFLLIIPLLIYFYKLYWRKRKEAALKFSALSIVKSATNRNRRSVWIRAHLPFLILTIIIALIVVGLADPMIPLKSAKEGV
ncbi:aerotolerance regulator BatA, partial [ANME-1 cluster archaeon AG-394-G06]|nr:aerotolerance regulator BatA [ANME-1 cluster archaeon AG-394-G06]